MMVGSIAVQFEVSENGIVLSVEKSGDGSGFETSEKEYSEMKIQDVIDILQNTDVPVIKGEDEDEEASYTFEDDDSSDGCNEYNISCGNDDEIISSIAGWDFECDSLIGVINALKAVFPEMKELTDFINGDY